MSKNILTFVLPRDLLPLSTLGLSLTGFFSATTSKTVGRSLIILNRRFLQYTEFPSLNKLQVKQNIAYKIYVIKSSHAKESRHKKGELKNKKFENMA